MPRTALGPGDGLRGRNLQAPSFRKPTAREKRGSESEGQIRSRRGEKPLPSRIWPAAETVRMAAVPWLGAGGWEAPRRHLGRVLTGRKGQPLQQVAGG